MSSHVTTDRSTYRHNVPWEDLSNTSQGYRVHGMIFISGQFSHDLQGAFIGEGDIEAQTRQTLSNLDRVLAAFGVTKNNLAELVVYLTNPQEHFEPSVAILKEYLGTPPHRPAGTLIGVTALAFPHQLIEIRAVAHTD